MSESPTPESELVDEINVIPVTDIDTLAGAYEHRVPPNSAAEAAYASLRSRRTEIHLPDEVIWRIAHGAVEPGQLESVRVEPLRVETGWLMVISYRAYSLMVSMAVENDRLLATARYAADPHADGLRTALSMPGCDDEHAVLVHPDSFAAVLESADRSAERVMSDNPQQVGERLVERPLMLTPVVFTSEHEPTAVELTAIDGNCRLASCYDRIRVRRGWLDGALPRPQSAEPVALLPSHLMPMSLEARRELVREAVKAAHARLKRARTGTPGDIEGRSRAAMALNAMTVPVQVIVGYQDDEVERGMQRFPAAVRALLMRMNVEPKPFDDGARNAVTAEEIVSGLYDEGLLYPGLRASAVRDALVGRKNVVPAMQELGLEPTWPDLRFALVVQQLTSNSRGFRAFVRSKMALRGKLTLARRNGPIVELGLRSYSARPETTSPRRALETGCVWQNLVEVDWDVENINTDEKVDALLARADGGETGAQLLLGVLGMINLVMSGHLLAAAGSAEQVAGTTIARTSVGSIIRGLLATREGRWLLADAVKQTRAGRKPRQWDSATGKLVEQPTEAKASTFNAYLRAKVLHGFEASEKRRPTDTDREAEAFAKFNAKLAEADDQLRQLIEMREKNGTIDLLPWTAVEEAAATIGYLTDDLRQISHPKPRDR
ncbi:hypothetical protein KDK95_26595 [Actinospica sp. MGRD01-02]|uniref:Uncharacterized protein n=1 Tax=Actinospica acidithermotolerans TaxID=2828514 RepID=A0A941IMD7_9ACTN|nr:hypothetical protein [Actinospica acidithermotolerans]MBR7829903.1 hypothetical protein [Actinospica acidithermotolerans]